MDILKTFLGHLYFSLCCTLVVFLVLYGLMAVIDGSFSVWANIYFIVGAFVVISVGLAAFLTYLTIKNRPKSNIVFTRRQQ